MTVFNATESGVCRGVVFASGITPELVAPGVTPDLTLPHLKSLQPHPIIIYLYIVYDVGVALVVVVGDELGVLVVVVAMVVVVV